MRVWTRLGVAAAAATPLLLLAVPAHAASPGASWSMEDPTVMTDSSGNGNTSTQLKQITSVPGFSGNGYHFVQGSLVTVPDSPTLDPGTADISITVHVKFDKVPDPKTVVDYDLIRKGFASTSGGEWKIEIFPPSGSTTVAPAFCLFKDAAKNVGSIRGSKNLANGQWHTITCTKTSSSIRLVVDDGATETKTLNKALGSISNDQPVGIGQKPEAGGGDQYVGDMDEVSIDIGSTTTGGDTTRPTVTAKSPTPSATGIPTATAVKATFSEAVTDTTVSTSTFKIRKSGTSTVLPATVTYDPATLTATLQPNSPLAAGTKYTTNLTTGIKDLAGNTLVATSWTFTTATSSTGADTTRPTVITKTPTPSATGVPTATAVTATFSEAVTDTTVSPNTFKIRKSGTSTVLPATVTYDPATLTATLQPNSPLVAGTKYTTNLNTGIKDLAGNALVATSWTFTTATSSTGGDTTRPTVTAKSPAPSATGVPRSTAVTATFSEAVHNLTTRTFKLKKSGTTRVMWATVTYDSTTMTATLQPNAALAARTRYTATLTAGIKDAVNLALKAISWSFRTAA